MKGTITEGGYLRVGLYGDDGKQHSKLIHVLVALIFTQNPENKLTVDHIDRNKLNNKVSNLRWATSSEQALNKEHNRRGIPIYQMDLNGNIIRRWEKIKEAARILNVHDVSISRTCKGNQETAGGFIWRYCQDVDNNSMAEEEWKLAPFPEYEPIYVSNYGRLMKQDSILTFGNQQGGYLVISLRKQIGGKTNVRVHRLVAATFLGRNDDLMVNHKDGNKQNNRLDNLEYTTNRENVQHAIDTGLRKYDTVTKRKVNQYDMLGNFIAQYSSITEAAKLNKLSAGTISTTCKGKRSHCGWYVWSLCLVLVQDKRPNNFYAIT